MRDISLVNAPNINIYIYIYIVCYANTILTKQINVPIKKKKKLTD